MTVWSLVFATYVVFLFSTAPAVLGQQASSPEEGRSPVRFDILLPAITSIIGAALGVIGTTLLGPWIKERFVLREHYFVPFKKWCSEAYGDLNEFERRYIKNKDTMNKISSIQIILDFRSLHEALIEAPKWIAKIEKDTKKERDEDTKGKDTKKSKVVEKITHLLEVVEVVWHALEDEHGTALRSAESIKEFNQGLKCLKPEKRKEIADQIRNHLHEQTDIYTTETFKPILDYLYEHVP